MKTENARMSSTPPRPSTPLVFLNRTGEETQVAKELAHQLRLAGVGIWLNVECPKPGDRWMEAIGTGLLNASGMVVYV
jgi:hypothetical protein